MASSSDSFFCGYCREHFQGEKHLLLCKCPANNQKCRNCGYIRCLLKQQSIGFNEFINEANLKCASCFKPVTKQDVTRVLDAAKEAAADYCLGARCQKPGLDQKKIKCTGEKCFNQLHKECLLSLILPLRNFHFEESGMASSSDSFLCGYCLEHFQGEKHLLLSKCPSNNQKCRNGGCIHCLLRQQSIGFNVDSLKCISCFKPVTKQDKVLNAAKEVAADCCLAVRCQRPGLDQTEIECPNEDCFNQLHRECLFSLINSEESISCPLCDLEWGSWIKIIKELMEYKAGVEPMDTAEVVEVPNAFEEPMDTTDI